MTRASFSPRGGPADAERTIRTMRRIARREARGLGSPARRAALRAWLAREYIPQPICCNCGKPGSHYAPPSFGEQGFFTCHAITEAMRTMPEQAGECHGYVEPHVWDAIVARGEKWPPNFSKQEPLPSFPANNILADVGGWNPL